MKTVLKQVPPDQNWGFTYLFDCPGCGCYHGFNETIWQFNGDLVKPTLNPSLLVTMEEGKKCHSFIREGRIQFLDDCWHDLKGQIVDLTPVTPLNPD